MDVLTVKFIFTKHKIEVGYYEVKLDNGKIVKLFIKSCKMLNGLYENKVDGEVIVIEKDGKKKIANVKDGKIDGDYSIYRGKDGKLIEKKSFIIKKK